MNDQNRISRDSWLRAQGQLRKSHVRPLTLPSPGGRGLAARMSAHNTRGVLDSGEMLVRLPRAWRGQPSPTGRGQGEGSDVTFTSAVIGAGARSSKTQCFRTNEPTRAWILAKCNACIPDPILGKRCITGSGTTEKA